MAMMMRSIGALRTVGRSLCVRALGYEAANMSPQTVWEASTPCAWESSRFMPRFQFDRSTLDSKMPINQIAVSHRPHFDHRVDFDLCTGGEGFPLVIAETERHLDVPDVDNSIDDLYLKDRHVPVDVEPTTNTPFFVTMATLEDALMDVSYKRGASIISEAATKLGLKGFEALVDEGRTYKATVVQMTNLSKCLDLAAWCNQHVDEMMHEIEAVDPFISVDHLSFDVFGTMLKSSFKCTAGAAMCSMQACKQAVVDMFEYISKHHDFTHVPMIVPVMEDKTLVTKRQTGANIVLRAVLDRDVVALIGRTRPEMMQKYFDQLNNVLEIAAAVLLVGENGVEHQSHLTNPHLATEFVRAHNALQDKYASAISKIDNLVKIDSPLNPASTVRMHRFTAERPGF